MFLCLQTSGTVPIQPDPFHSNLQKEFRRKFCCSCGRKGHYGFECKTAHMNARFGYSILEQSVFSYSEPVVEVDGDLVLNTEKVSYFVFTELMFVELSSVSILFLLKQF